MSKRKEKVIEEIQSEEVATIDQLSESEIAPEGVTASSLEEVKPFDEKKYPPKWEQIRDQLSSVSAMVFELTQQRITHGDAVSIFKTDAHRQLYQRWLKFKLGTGDLGG